MLGVVDHTKFLNFINYFLSVHREKEHAKAIRTRVVSDIQKLSGIRPIQLVFSYPAG